jgi:hypothetical protein
MVLLGQEMLAPFVGPMPMAPNSGFPEPASLCPGLCAWAWTWWGCGLSSQAILHLGVQTDAWRGYRKPWRWKNSVSPGAP